MSDSKHSGAHLSKNWTKEDQKSYHHKWYEEHKKVTGSKKKSGPFKVLETQKERQERIDKTNDAEADFDEYLAEHSNAFNKALYTIRNETVADTVDRIKKHLKKNKDKDTNLAIAHFDDVPFNDETIALAHHGILGMKWGQLNGPPYPIGRNSNTTKTHSAGEKAAAKKAGIKVGSSSGTTGGHKTIAQIYKDKQTKKKRIEGLQKARVAKADKAEHERQRQEALNSGDPKRIQSVMKESSAEEIQKALDRADLYAKVNSRVPKEKGAMDKIDSAMNTISKVNDWYSTATKVYNNFAKTYNLVNSESDDLPIFGENNSNLKSGKEKQAAKRDKNMSAFVNKAIREGDYSAYDRHPGWFTKKDIEDLQGTNIAKSKFKNRAVADADEKALRELNVDYIRANQDHFTNQQIQDAAKRMNNLNNLYSGKGTSEDKDDKNKN